MNTFHITAWMTYLARVVAVCAFNLGAQANANDLAAPVFQAEEFTSPAFSQNLAGEAIQAGFRDCDVCPAKPGQQALPVEPMPSAKRCDTCSDTDTMGVDNDRMNTPLDFSDYLPPLADSPESLKPF
jgi:hypothetical protein